MDLIASSPYKALHELRYPGCLCPKLQSTTIRIVFMCPSLRAAALLVKSAAPAVQVDIATSHGPIFSSRTCTASIKENCPCVTQKVSVPCPKLSKALFAEACFTSLISLFLASLVSATASRFLVVCFLVIASLYRILGVFTTRNVSYQNLYHALRFFGNVDSL